MSDSFTIQFTTSDALADLLNATGSADFGGEVQLGHRPDPGSRGPATHPIGRVRQRVPSFSKARHRRRGVSLAGRRRSEAARPPRVARPRRGSGPGESGLEPGARPVARRTIA